MIAGEGLIASEVDVPLVVRGFERGDAGIDLAGSGLADRTGAPRAGNLCVQGELLVVALRVEWRVEA